MPEITREQFIDAMEVVWGELKYQDKLPRRTESDEPKDPGAFATLGRVYLRQLEIAWALNEGNEISLPFLRKLAAIFVRSMIYCGIRERDVA